MTDPTPADPAEQLLAEILKVIEDSERNAYSIGTLWNRVLGLTAAHRKRQSPRAWWAAHVPASVLPVTASRYGRVAKRYPPDVAARFPITLLSLYLTYCQAAGIAPATDPGPAVIHVPSGTGVVDKPFSACTKEDLQAALQKKKTPPKGPALDPVHAKLVAMVDERLVKVLGNDHATQFTAQRQGDDWNYSLLHAPDDAILEVLDAVADAIKTLQAELGG